MKNNKLEKLKLTKRILLFTLALILSNCQDTDNLTTQEQTRIKTVGLDEAKTFLISSTKNSSAKLSNNKIANLEFDKATLEKINGSDQLLTVIPFITNNEIQNDRILVVKIDNKIKSVIFSMQSDENSIVGQFSGKLYIYSLEGDFINGYRAKNGIITTQFIESVTKSTAKTIDGGELKEVVLTKPKIVNATDWDMIWGSGGSSIGYSPSGGVSGISWDATGGGGSNGNSITAPSMVQIIDELTEKAKCINSQLNKNGNSFVQKLLANFQGKSEFNIKIVSTEKVTTLDKNGLPKEINGKTIHIPGSSLMTIEISTSRANANAALDVARTILHEYIHADIFRKLNTASTEIGNRSSDFKNTYDQYENQHGVIAGLYLNSMKEALKEFHRTILVDDYNKYTAYYGEVPSDAFYEALAWGGLKDSDVKAWTDLPEEKKAAIEKLANRVPLLSKTAPCLN